MPSPRRLLSPRAYAERARRFWFELRYDPEPLRQQEREKFAAAGLDPTEAATELNRHLAAMGLPPFEHCEDMASVHWLLFACLRARPVRRILEIGTYDGQTTALLARLFPQSEIVTVELPANDPILARTYDYARGGAERLREFECRLQSNVSAPNITLLRANSFFLPAQAHGQFDLVWVDGGHLFPEIAWDICNAYHLTRTGGCLMCDDVIPDAKGFRDQYVSRDAYNVLRYVTDRTGETLRLFLKRDSQIWAADPRRRKYVSMLVKE